MRYILREGPSRPKRPLQRRMFSVWTGKAGRPMKTQKFAYDCIPEAADRREHPKARSVFRLAAKRRKCTTVSECHLASEMSEHFSAFERNPKSAGRPS